MKKILIILFIFIVSLIIYYPFGIPKINIPKDANYICFVDFRRLSCMNRLFIYDVHKKMIVYSAQVQHGNGGKSTIFKPEFSNKIGSNCSSLGLYKITTLDKMRSNKMVDCFRLRGLNNTNSNAETRGILIHPGFGVSLTPNGVLIPITSESRGCFTVSLTTIGVLKYFYKKGNIYIYAYG